MMKAVITVSTLMMLTACLAQEERQAPSNVPLRVECDNLFNEFMNASTKFADRAHKAKTLDEASKSSPPNGPAYAARFLSMAKAHPDDPVAVDALVRVLIVDFFGPHRKEVIDRIRARHVKSPRIGAALRLIAIDTTPPAVEPLLRDILRENPSAEVRAQAAVALAEHLMRLIGEAENMHEHPDQFEHAVTRFGACLCDSDAGSRHGGDASRGGVALRAGDPRISPGTKSSLELRDRPSPAEVATGELRSLREPDRRQASP